VVDRHLRRAAAQTRRPGSDMTLAKWLVLAGGVLLLAGILTAFLSDRYQSRVMGKATLGVGVWAPDEGSHEWREKERLRRRAELWFYAGLATTGVGVILQTIGALLPDRQ